MERKEYTDRRVELRTGSLTPVENTAVDRLHGLVQSFVPYTPAVRAWDAPADEKTALTLIPGTLNGNPRLRMLADRGFFQPETRPEGYSVKTAPDPDDPSRRLTVLQGADPAGVLYAAADYERYAIRDREVYEGYIYNRHYRPFIDPALPFARQSAPAIEHRGLWTWGHVICDFRGYIDHMADNRMNTLIVWNDFAPSNAAEIVAYAHEHAVKVIWGFSWCWGEPVDPQSAADLEKWTQRVLDTYEKQYLPTGGDGIYFQAFTETKDTVIGGESIASLAARWVDAISRAVYARFPDLWIQFGVHATSIRESADEMRQLDPRMSIVWEDAGGFPYAYDPRKSDDAATLDYTRRLLSLRGERERFGAVFKGYTVLNWPTIEHQRSAFPMGVMPEPYKKARAGEKEFYWRFVAPYWIRKAPFLQTILQTIARAPVADRLVTALVEDGLWEESSHTSAAILAELMWDPDADLDAVLDAVFHDSRNAI